jgi:hypothetical protein
VTATSLRMSLSTKKKTTLVITTVMPRAAVTTGM